MQRPDLIWRALCAVHEAAEQARAGPVPPTWALRFALAYLFAVSDRARWPYDGFWREMQRPAGYATQDDYQRGTTVHAHLLAIVRSVGLEATSGTLGRLIGMQARNSPEAIARRKLARQVREAAAVERDASDPSKQDHG